MQPSNIFENVIKGLRNPNIGLIQFEMSDIVPESKTKFFLSDCPNTKLPRVVAFTARDSVSLRCHQLKLSRVALSAYLALSDFPLNSCF